MKTLAAVLVETGKPLELADLQVPALQPGQVLVEVAFAGVCHTQVLECRGHRGHDPFLPHCLGHEGSGIVREVGAGVTKVRAGDRVILSWIKGRGADVPGSVYDWQGRKVNAGAITTFSRFTVISENRLTGIGEQLQLDAAAMLGCAVPTGLGAVFNTARPTPGQSLVVFGIGGVGICAIAGAVIAGCVPVIAVDVKADKLTLAKKFGATHTIDASTSNVLDAIKAICPDGVDHAIEATGRPTVMAQALQCVRMRGGNAVIVGNAPHGQFLELDPKQLNMGKRLLGTWGGDSDPDRDYHRYAKLISSGKLDLSPLLSATYTLERINEAIDDLETARVARPLVKMQTN